MLAHQFNVVAMRLLNQCVDNGTDVLNAMEGHQSVCRLRSTEPGVWRIIMARMHFRSEPVYMLHVDLDCTSMSKSDNC